MRPVTLDNDPLLKIHRSLAMLHDGLAEIAASKMDVTVVETRSAMETRPAYPGIDLTAAIKTVLKDIELSLDNERRRYCYAFAHGREIREGEKVLDAAFEGATILFTRQPMLSKHLEAIGAITAEAFRETLSRESPESFGSQASQ